MRTAVLDLDGVLFNVDERLKLCLSEVGARAVEELAGAKRKQFWVCFLSAKYMHLDKPNQELVSYVKKLRSEGVRIVIVTGRREDTQKELTLEQLRRAGVEFDEIYFRRAGDFRKDHEYKADIIKQLIEKGHEIAEVWDDSESVINTVKELIPSAKVVHYKR